MDKNILITGGFGFFGRHSATYFNSKGFNVVGIGHGSWSKKGLLKWGFHKWHESSVSLDSLVSLNFVPDLIIHCAGGSSVSESIKDPERDLQRTVTSTKEVLEFMKLVAPTAQLIYPSSPAVHGVHDIGNIKTNDPLAPVSPYGIHKKMAEELCFQYHKDFGLGIKIIRFFSLYGEYLQKQLLWDACNKFSKKETQSNFWGSGDEVRDWIHVDDALKLIDSVLESSSKFEIINGGTGTGHSVSHVLTLLKALMENKSSIVFTGVHKTGDPKYYTAQMPQDWIPNITLEAGLRRYVAWFNEGSLND